MNYKQRHLIPPTWSRDEFNVKRRPEPYDHFTPMRLRELYTPDGELSLLLLQAGIDELTGLVTFYAIEAPSMCPVRKAFEWGEVTWADYWNHRPWLFEITYSMEGGDATSRYIDPSEIKVETKDRFERMGHRGPYILKYEQVKGGLKHLDHPGWDAEGTIRTYQDFILRHGERLRKIFPEDFGDETSKRPNQKLPAGF